MDKSDVSDEELMVQYQNGSERAFTTLYQRYAAKVFGYLRQQISDRETAEDALQNVFSKLHRSRIQYDSSFPFAPWIFTIARTIALDTKKVTSRQTRHSSLSDLDYERIAAPENINSEAVDLTSLSKVQRTAIEMRFSEDKSFEEIAKKLETTPGNVRQMISRGIKQLRNLAVKEESS